jgi:hypothetical protein
MFERQLSCARAGNVVGVDHLKGRRAAPRATELEHAMMEQMVTLWKLLLSWSKMVAYGPILQL